MLRKLLKYEFKATGRLMLPLLIALLAISGLLAVCVRISENTASAVVHFVTGTLGFLYVMAILAIGAVVLGTMLTRFLPFLVFPADRPTPKFIQYLGRVLPGAVFALLIVYCLRGTTFTTPGGWVPPLVAGGAAVLLHLWKGNDMLSIFGATILYMVLVQGVFG